MLVRERVAHQGVTVAGQRSDEGFASGLDHIDSDLLDHHPGPGADHVCNAG